MYHSYVALSNSTATRALNANPNPSALPDPDNSAGKSRSGLAWYSNAALRYNSPVSESLYFTPFNLPDMIFPHSSPLDRLSRNCYGRYYITEAADVKTTRN